MHGVTLQNGSNKQVPPPAREQDAHFPLKNDGDAACRPVCPIGDEQFIGNPLVLYH